jgi:hypothetical protein
MELSRVEPAISIVAFPLGKVPSPLKRYKERAISFKINVLNCINTSSAYLIDSFIRNYKRCTQNTNPPSATIQTNFVNY